MNSLEHDCSVLRWSARDLAVLLGMNSPRSAERWISGQNHAPPRIAAWVHVLAEFHRLHPPPQESEAVPESRPRAGQTGWRLGPDGIKPTQVLHYRSGGDRATIYNAGERSRHMIVESRDLFVDESEALAELMRRSSAGEPRHGSIEVVR